MGIWEYFKKKGNSKNQSNLEFKTMEKPDFGKIQLENLNDYYNTQTKYGHRELKLDINFEVKSTNQTELNKILNFIDRIPALDKSNEIHIKNDLNLSPSMSQEYFTFYVEELEDELQNIIEVGKNLQTNIIRLHKKLNLIRVGLYPQADYFGTFDYSIDIDGEPCNQLLVVNINENGSLNHITWES